MAPEEERRKRTEAQDQANSGGASHLVAESNGLRRQWLALQVASALLRATPHDAAIQAGAGRGMQFAEGEGLRRQWLAPQTATALLQAAAIEAATQAPASRAASDSGCDDSFDVDADEETTALCAYGEKAMARDSLEALPGHRAADATEGPSAPAPREAEEQQAAAQSEGTGAGRPAAEASEGGLSARIRLLQADLERDRLKAMASIPEPPPAALPVGEAEEERQQAQEAEAARRIAGAYGRWRLRRCIAEAVLQGRRARKRAPVDAALRRRAEAEQQVAAQAAARRLQSEWRARKLRRWCQRIDRAARRLQGWMRRRWHAQKIERYAERLRVRATYKVDKPPLPPSQWPEQRLPAEVAPAEVASAAPLVPAAPASLAACAPCAPPSPRAGASLACPPPRKKPPKPGYSGPDWQPQLPAPGPLRSYRSAAGGGEEILFVKPSAAGGVALAPPKALLRAPHAGADSDGGVEPPRCALPKLRRPAPRFRSSLESRSASPRVGMPRVLDSIA